jgi:hypothetical protein
MGLRYMAKMEKLREEMMAMVLEQPGQPLVSRRIPLPVPSSR